METTIKVSNREIAIRAFDYLRHDRKTDSALRQAHHLLHYDRISLGNLIVLKTVNFYIL